MAVRRPHPHVRYWRWLASGAALLVLAATYWVVLERIGIQTIHDNPPPRASPGLDRHTPRVD